MTEPAVPATPPAAPPALHVGAAELGVLLALLVQHLPGLSLWAYGSRVAGWPGSRGLEPHSDLDLAVPGQLSDLVLATSRADLEDSDLPWRVDLTSFDALPRAMRELIVRHGRLLPARAVSVPAVVVRVAEGG